MSYNLAEDPFKRRLQTRHKKQPLVLSKSVINRIISLSETIRIDDTNKLKQQEKQKEREAYKELTEAFSKKKVAGTELKKKHYSKDVQSVRIVEDKKTRDEARKKVVLDKAYERLYKETDRVKYFNSAKNLCEILKQRQDQVDDKLSQLNHHAKYDAQFVLGLLRDVDNFKYEEEDKAKLVRQSKEKNAAAWINQHNEDSPVFWPQSGSVYQGSIKIQHISSEPEYFGGVLIRKFHVKNPKGKSRTVKTFHLHGWRREDFVPPQVDTVVQLIARVDKWTRKNKPAPVIVTCYNGSRASGFYCAASYLAGQIHDKKEADVVRAVRTIRLHRPAFIPTVEQYRWLYELACFLVSDKTLRQ